MTEKPPLRFDVFAIAYDTEDKPLGCVTSIADDFKSCGLSMSLPNPSDYPDDVREQMRQIVPRVLKACEDDPRLSR